LPVFDIDRCAGRKEDRSQPRGRMRQQHQLWRYPYMHGTVWGLLRSVRISAAVGTRDFLCANM
jgi:hypothetical protein